jgi:hypothetical protein
MLPQILVSKKFKIFSPAQILQIHLRHHFKRSLLAEMLSLTGNTSTENVCQPVGEYLVQNSNHRIYFGTSKQHYKIDIRSWSIAVNSFTDYHTQLEVM